MWLDPAYMANVCISVSLGSIIATLIVLRFVSRKAPKIASETIRKTIVSTLDDPEIQKKVSSFIENHIVKPFNSINNVELKHLITKTAEEALELMLKKLKDKKTNR